MTNVPIVLGLLLIFGCGVVVGVAVSDLWHSGDFDQTDFIDQEVPL